MQHFFQECNLFLAISANNFFNNRHAGYQKLAAHLAEDYKEYCSSIQAPYQIFYFPLSSISISSPISLIQSSIEAAYTIFHIPLSSILSVSNSREMSRETEIRISSFVRSKDGIGRHLFGFFQHQHRLIRSRLFTTALWETTRTLH